MYSKKKKAYIVSRLACLPACASIACLALSSPHSGLAWAQTEIPATQPANVTPPASTRPASDAPGSEKLPSTQPTPKAFAYRPLRDRGIPVGPRWGGGARATPGTVEISVLAPQGTGLSLSQTPVLYWMTDGGPETPYRLTLTGIDDDAPVLEQAKLPLSPGRYQSIKLADLKITLQRGKVYRWSISVPLDPQNPAKDPFASGVVMIATDEQVHSAQTSTPAYERAADLAAAGYWYDTLDILIPAVTNSATPVDPRMQQALNSLMTSQEIRVIGKSGS